MATMNVKQVDVEEHDFERALRMEVLAPLKEKLTPEAHLFLKDELGRKLFATVLKQENRVTARGLDKFNAGSEELQRWFHANGIDNVRPFIGLIMEWAVRTIFRNKFVAYTIRDILENYVLSMLEDSSDSEMSELATETSS